MKPEVKVYDDHFLELYDPEQELIQIADGLFTGEGPVWHEGDQCLYFSDIGGMRTLRFTEAEGLRLAFNNGTMGNGLCVTLDGRLLMCEHATSSLSIWRTDGTERRVLADYYGDIQLNSPNDVVQRKDGLIYFTDPNYGRGTRKSNVHRPDASPIRAVYAYHMETKALLQVANGFDAPNGLCFSPDESILYVGDSIAGKVMAFDSMPDGRLVRPRLFATCAGLPDGMKTDAEGNLFIATQPIGVECYNPAGKLLGTISIADTRNLAWGGEDFTTLFITCGTCAFMLRTRIAGQRYQKKLYDC